ncbi:L-glutamate gamma-semialdehyde dehydrogenase [Leptolyngbya sp. BL0902]|uniref:aldehyde dehydrogenase family protein n=1 Tax=Leptolyngbya sp. BL0902 TaxID=1115757 RepID=UPI0018E71068|nr:aldehyde dehydrogenase family protein [Leptolyngbya sp. BL0902]QQE63820.1 L-glutamate gamma-semialdehyde dehydrogenase [Leptolyngbya sp. BL0902]
MANEDPIFAPVIVAITAQDFDDILCISDDTDDGLAGELYFRPPFPIERGQTDLAVVNLYTNRSSRRHNTGRHTPVNPDCDGATPGTRRQSLR